MSKWYDTILSRFIPHVASITLVFDPDHILSEATIIQELKAKKFQLIFYEDALSFRYIYESQYREHLKELSNLGLLLVNQQGATASKTLPYDIVAGTDRQVAISLASLFPNLSYPVVRELDQSLVLAPDQGNFFNALFRAASKLGKQQLNEVETKDFILQQIFQVNLESIQTLPSLLHTLLRLHYKGFQLPCVLSQYLVESLISHPAFEAIPLANIIPDRQAFFGFLQQHWATYVKDEIRKSRPSAADSSADLDIYGPTTELRLPFGEKDVRAYIDSLFLEGLLKPVKPDSLGLETYETERNDWFRVGLEIDPQAEILNRCERLIEKTEPALPTPDAEHTEWLSFAHQWAELITLWYRLSHDHRSALDQAFKNVQAQVDASFLAWVTEQYGTLHYKPPTKPAMVHHIPRFMARQLEAGTIAKAALLLMDGLALDQWLVLQDILANQSPDLTFHSSAVFAWIPSITSVSRQALFAGKPPAGFPQSIFKTQKEPQLWQQFWADHGLSKDQVSYHAGLREIEHLDTVREAISHPNLRVLGLVVDKVDKISHHKESGTPDMHQQIRPWAEQGFLRDLLKLLLNDGFSIFLTADHGNIETDGIGSPTEKAIADYRGQRVRIYSEPALRAQVKEKFPEAIEWDSPVLPPNYLPLLAPGRTAFVDKGKAIVTHGGISVEELIVPFIQIG
jgi:hypothetical protein